MFFRKTLTENYSLIFYIISNLFFAKWITCQIILFKRAKTKNAVNIRDVDTSACKTYKYFIYLN